MKHGNTIHSCCYVIVGAFEKNRRHQLTKQGLHIYNLLPTPLYVHPCNLTSYAQFNDHNEYCCSESSLLA